MTLDTRVYVVDHVDLRELFTKCQELIGQYDEDRRGPAEQKSRLTSDCLMNEGMQGLPGWLMVYHGGARPYRTSEEASEHEYCNHPSSDYFNAEWHTCTETEHDPPCWYEVSVDTAYGYRSADGMGCGDLHARFVAELGRWLDQRNVRWKWKNEFTGDVHDDYESLISLASGGFEASAWFRSMVLLAITARAVGGA